MREKPLTEQNREARNPGPPRENASHSAPSPGQVTASARAQWPHLDNVGKLDDAEACDGCGPISLSSRVVFPRL